MAEEPRPIEELTFREAMAELDGKQFKSVADEDALPQTEEEKKDKYLFVSEQGTMEAKLEGRVETYLTFRKPEQSGD